MEKFVRKFKREKSKIKKFLCPGWSEAPGLK